MKKSQLDCGYSEERKGVHLACSYLLLDKKKEIQKNSKKVLKSNFL